MLFFKKENFIKKRLWRRFFRVNFKKFLKNIYFGEYLRMAASPSKNF